MAQTSAAVNIDGATFKNVATHTSGAFAAIVSSGGAVDVKNTTFENSRCAIFLLNGGTLTQENNTYTNNAADVYNQSDDTNTVYTESAFVASVKNGGKIVLGTDIPLTATVMIPVDKSVEITGNGFNIDASGLSDRVFVTEKTYTGTFTLNNVNVTGFSKTVVTTEGGNLIINGGMYDANNNQTHIVLAKTSTTVKVDGATFKNVAASSSSVSSAIIASGGTVDVKNSTFENNRAAIIVMNSATITKSNNTYVNNLADVYYGDTDTNRVYTETSLKESLKNGGQVIIHGDIVLSDTSMTYEVKDMLEVVGNAKLTIAEGVTLVVPETSKIVNYGTIENKGTIDKKGIIENKNDGKYVEMGKTMYTYMSKIVDNTVPGNVDKLTLVNMDSVEMNKIIEESIMNNEMYRNTLLASKTSTVELIFNPVEISDENMKYFKDAMPDLNIAQFLNIEILLTTEMGTMKIEELSEKIRITFAMPEGFDMALEGKERTFYILREHAEVIEKLELTKNEDGTYSFYSDKFSTYAVAYIDIDRVVNPETSDNVLIFVSIILISTIGLGVTGYKLNKSRK